MRVLLLLMVSGLQPLLGQYDPVIAEQNRRLENEKINRKLDELLQPTPIPIPPQVANTPEGQALLLERLRLENELKQQQIEKEYRNRKSQHKKGPGITSKRSESASRSSAINAPVSATIDSNGQSLSDQTRSNSSDAAEIQRLEAELAAAQRESQALFDKAVDASQAKAVRFYPMMKDENHLIHRVAEKIWNDWETMKDARTFDPDAPFIVYSLAAKELHIAPAVSE